MTSGEFSNEVIGRVAQHWPLYAERMRSAPAKAEGIYRCLSRYAASDVVQAIDRYSADHQDETLPKALWTVVGERLATIRRGTSTGSGTDREYEANVRANVVRLIRAKTPFIRVGESKVPINERWSDDDVYDWWCREIRDKPKPDMTGKPVLHHKRTYPEIKGEPVKMWVIGTYQRGEDWYAAWERITGEPAPWLKKADTAVVGRLKWRKPDARPLHETMPEYRGKAVQQRMALTGVMPRDSTPPPDDGAYCSDVDDGVPF
jgi:hypothetical protein